MTPVESSNAPPDVRCFAVAPPSFPAGLRHGGSRPFEDVPLIAFTLLAQAAVGCCLAMLPGSWQGGWPGATVAPWLRVSIPALILTALICSLGHLGSFRHPGSSDRRSYGYLRSLANSRRALFGLRASWLSREILCGLLFLGTSSVVAVAPLTGAAATAAVIASGISGLALLTCMGFVYRIRTVPAWDTPVTGLSFFLTSASLGCLAVGSATRLPWVAVAAAVGVALQLWLQRWWLVRLRRGPEVSRKAWGRIHGTRGTVPRLRFALGAAATVLAATAAVSVTSNELLARSTHMLAQAVFISALVLATASEVLGRVLFFRARVRAGL